MSPPNQDAQEGRPDSPTAEVVDVRRGMFGVSGTGDTSGYGRLVRQVVLPGSSPGPTAATSTISSTGWPRHCGTSASNSRTPSRKSWSTAMN